MNGQFSAKFQLIPPDGSRLAKLCGQYNENLKQIEQKLGVVIYHHGQNFQVSGPAQEVEKTQKLLQRIYLETNKEDYITPEQIHLLLRDMESIAPSNNTQTASEVVITTKAGVIKGYTANQRHYLANIAKYDINISIGPAGTGKTYLAVASAVAALEKSQVMRILLVRPVVEAGEKLGFLPGGLEEKVAPYLRPLYDALYAMLGFERVGKLIEQNIIEVAPLAYMRGRTLNDAFIILDESQNTTIEQMKMFLTRIGFNSKVIITGDITQIDLPRGKRSGLADAESVLKGIEGICFSYFGSSDVVRHTLVQRIVEAYNQRDQQREQSS